MAVASLASSAGARRRFVDYQLTPKRRTPGFEHRLARPETASVYVCFALGLMVGGLLMKRRAG